MEELRNRKRDPLVELGSPVTLSVYTKVPSKYFLIDTETNRVFVGNSDSTWHEIMENEREKS